MAIGAFSFTAKPSVQGAEAVSDHGAGDNSRGLAQTDDGARGSLRTRFARSRSGVAALEFAIIAPVVILLLVGGFEIDRYLRQVQQITNVANSVAEMIAENTVGYVTDTDLHFYIDSTMLMFPDLLQDSTSQGLYWWQNISVSMNSVNFTPTVPGCTSSCNYTAKVVWSSSSNYPRPCSTFLTPAADAALPTPTTLPSDAYGPGTIVVVDVVYTYQPVVAKSFLSSVQIKRSFYIQPRYVSLVKYQPNVGDMATGCSSY